VAEPVDVMRDVYRRLELGNFAEVEPAIAAYFTKSRDYQTNKYTLPPDVADRVRGRWAPYFQRYGYNGHALESASA
jgi:hypothetical protein